MNNVSPSKSRTDALRYIAEMIAELSQMAEANRFPCVHYFLQMAYVESYDILRGDRSANPKMQKKAVARSEPLKREVAL